MVEDATQYWAPQDYVTATFTDPHTGKAHPVTVIGFTPLHGRRSYVMFADGHKQWVALADVKR